MCGFAGVLGGAQVSEELLRDMAFVIHHRGPDDQGVWFDSEAGIGLSHARLSILDLSPAGHQPMVSASGRYVIAFNGEIYNHVSLRDHLEKINQAPEWHGHSDTETIVAGFDAWGIENTIIKTIGMFAFAAWDRQTQTLVLGRDRLGEKPLFYGWLGDSFLFGSELKALRVHPCFNTEVDRDALASFMRFSYIPSPQSIYRGIHKLIPGSLLRVQAKDNSYSKPVQYWSMKDVARDGLQSPFTGSDSEAIEELEAVLSEAVTLQQLADVPLGAFLSGGIDSSMIVSLMQAQSIRPIHTFTIGFHDHQYNEAVHAKVIARHLGTDHTELYVTPEEARAVIPRLPTLYDEPFADISQIPTFLVSQLARRNVTVSLSGDAGDELFGGYNRYAWMHKLLKVPAGLRWPLANCLSALRPAQWDWLYAVMCPLLPESLQVSMPGDRASKLASVLAMKLDSLIYQNLVSTCPNPEDIVLNGYDTTDLTQAWDELVDLETPENRMMALDALTYLPDDILCKVDRASMGVSLETRVPFLDHRVVAYAWRLPLNMKIRNGKGKWVLRQLLSKYMPRELIDRPKMGFGVPIDSWLRGPIRDWADNMLNKSRLKSEGYLNPNAIRQKWEEHLSGKRNWQYLLWNVIIFQSWLEEQGR
jgi:asparagine synthase (glutamine-hydrolysing)